MGERRYPPSPYPPRSDATRAYRDGYDLGWKHVAVKGRTWAHGYWHDAGPADAPSQVGYADGARARLRWEQRAKRVEPDILRANREMDERDRRAFGEAEAPY